MGCSVVVVGSSVAAGKRATGDCGWAARLGEALQAPAYQLTLHNEAVPSYNTNMTMPRGKNTRRWPTLSVLSGVTAAPQLDGG